MDAIPLRSVRPLIFKTICVTDLNKERVDLKDQNLKRLAENIEKELQYEVEEMISEVDAEKKIGTYFQNLSQADTKMTGHPLQGKLPLIRLRVEYTDESQQLNSARYQHPDIKVCLFQFVLYVDSETSSMRKLQIPVMFSSSRREPR